MKIYRKEDQDGALGPGGQNETGDAEKRIECDGTGNGDGQRAVNEGRK